MQITFHNTHAYPGCPATVIVGRKPARTGKAVVEFSDGSVAAGNYRLATADEVVLRVAPYVTARKTRIGRKRWLLKRTSQRPGWKVARKIA